MLINVLAISFNICRMLIEMVLFSTYNICFDLEKIIVLELT